MIFRELTETEFSSFSKKHELKNFIQTTNMAELRQKLGCTIYYVGVEKDHDIVAGTFLSARKTHFGQTDFYAPRGLLVDYKDKELLTFFVENLKRFIKDKKGYNLRIDPYYIRKERDINGDVVEGGIDNTEGVNNLISLGFEKSPVAEQVVTWTFVLDLDKDENELLKSMRSFTRRNIQKGIKNKIVIRDVEYDELPLVKELLDATGDRKNFHNRSLEYFQKMYDCFHKDKLVKFVVAEIHTKTLLADLRKEKEDAQVTIKRMEEQKSKEEKIKKHRDNLEKIEKQIQEVEALQKEKGDVIPASTGVFMLFGDDLVYLFGGNKKEYMHFGTPYIIQWEMIKYGMQHHFKRYNFYGISGNFDKNDKEYGVYDFKKGFTGYVEELIGEYHLPINKFYYNLFKLIHKVRG